MRKLFLVWLVLLIISLSTSIGQDNCSYTTYKWNVNQRKAVQFENIKHSKNGLTKVEVDSITGCTVCREDQVEVSIGDIPPFFVCKKFAPVISQIIQQLYDEGFPLYKIVAYRVGMTKGDVDPQGNRTRFSNHSYGIAIDINEDQNGLYDHCVSFGPQCRLRKGGKWDPKIKGSLTANSRAVKLMKKMGFKWGGEIAGRQKDFMHFSLTGY